jgi:hypothetical protein
MGDFQLSREERGAFFLFFMEPLQYSSTMRTAILGYGSMALKQTLLGSATSEGLRTDHHARFLSHVQKLETILQDGLPSSQALAEISSVLASAPDPVTGEPYPDEMVLAYESYLGSSCFEAANIWLPAALALVAVSESASSSSTSQSMIGIGGLKEVLWWVHTSSRVHGAGVLVGATVTNSLVSIVLPAQ